MKKAFFALVLSVVVAGGVFAEGGGLFDLKSGPTRQNGVLFVDLGYTLSYIIWGGFGIGAGWEGKINKNWTWQANAAFGAFEYQSVAKWTDFGAEASARYYFFGTALDKLFINAGLGFSYYTLSMGNASNGFGALTIPLYAGWKFIFGPGFVVEADVGYRVAIGIMAPDGMDASFAANLGHPFGGFIGGIRLGWAF